MRVIGYIDTKGYKTTVFKNNNRFIIKFESDMFEQAFKFRESDKIANLNDITNLMDYAFLEEVEARFKEMYHSNSLLLERFLSLEEELWEEIV